MSRGHTAIVDPVGHYAWPDVFHLAVDARPRPPVTFTRG